MWWRKAHADTLLPGWADVLEIITEKAMPAHQALTAKREALPRVACHRRGDVREIARIAQKGTWRGPNVDDPEKQTLNEQKGGQGDEWAHVEAQVRSEDLQAKEACDHNQRRRECPVCPRGGCPCVRGRRSLSWHRLLCSVPGDAPRFGTRIPVAPQ